MADADEVWQHVERARRPVLGARAQRRGAQRALDAGFREIEVVSASETHNRRNVEPPHAESLASVADRSAMLPRPPATVEVIVVDGVRVPLRGRHRAGAGRGHGGQGDRRGADRFAFGDTTGMATPRRVAELLDA